MEIKDTRQLRMSPSEEAWQEEIHRLLRGERDASIARLGSAEDYVSVTISASADPAKALTSFQRALKAVVQGWEPLATDAENFTLYMLDLIRAHTPSSAYGKLIGFLKNGGKFPKNVSFDGYAIPEDLHMWALAILERYFPASPISDSAESFAFGSYIEILKMHLDDVSYGEYSEKRLIDLGVHHTSVVAKIHEQTILRTAIGGRQRPNLTEKSPEKALITLRFDYVSKASDNTYNRLTANLIEELEKVTGAVELQLTSDHLRWDVLAAYSRENIFDFCPDPYFRFGPRSPLVDVVQFGWVKTFTCVMEREAKFSSLREPKAPFGQTLIEALLRSKEAEVGVLGETAAAMEVFRALRKYPALSCKTFARESPAELRFWLDQKPKTRFVICDHGIERDIREMTPVMMKSAGLPVTQQYFDKRQLQYRSYVGNSPGHYFEFVKPIPVGFIYPLGDNQWRNLICRAFLSVLSDRSTPWNSNDSTLESKGVQDCLADVGIEALPLEILDSQLREVVHDINLQDVRTRDEERLDALLRD